MIISFKKNILFKDLNQEKIGTYSFYLGIFFLASAVGLSMMFLLVSQFISFLKPSKFLKDKWNYPLITSAALMSMSSFVHFLRHEKLIDNRWLRHSWKSHYREKY